MKKFKILFLMVAMLTLFSVGALFGCGDKYANMKLTTDLIENAVELYLDQDDQQQDASTKTFVISVDGVGGDISKTIKMPYGAENLVKTTLTKQDKTNNKTQVTLSAISCGEADMIFTSEEGGKILTIHVSVGYRLKSIQYNSSYKPYALVGETTKINTAKCLTFMPSETTQKEVRYQMLDQYPGVELLPDGTIITSADARNGSFRVKATSTKNEEIFTGEFTVSVIAGIEKLDVKYGETELEISDSNLVFENDALFFASNMIEESYKILELNALPEESNFVFIYAFTDLQGKITSKTTNGVVASNVFECNVIDQNHFGITALTNGDELLEIRAYIDGFEYLSKSYYIKLHSEQLAKNVTVKDFDNDQAFNMLTIYDEYNGGQGKAIKVEVGNVNAENKNFVVRIADGSVNMANKISIYTGKRDKSGNLIPAKLYTADTDDYDVFASGTILYVMAVKENITGDATDIIDIDFVAFGTMGLLGQEVYKSVKFDLKIGVSKITLENDTFNDILYVPIKETINGETLVEATQIKLLTKENEYTYSIQTNSENDGYCIQNEIIYQNSVVQGNSRQYTFEIYGIKEGVYTLNFFAQNGLNIDVKIRVFTKVDELTITTNSVEQNSDIGQIEYKRTTSQLPTLEGGQLILKLGGSANLNINAYYQTYLRRINYQSITYDFENNTIVRVDSANRIYGYNKGETKVTAHIVVFDDLKAGGVNKFDIEFNVVVYIALQSVAINTKNVTIYTKSTLGDYVDENGVSDQQKYGEFTFVLKINPERTEINPDTDISAVWSGSEKALLKSSAQYQYIQANNTYNIKIGINSLPVTKEFGSAKLTVTVSQYGRIIIQEADILIKNAKKVENIYDVKKVQDKVSTNLVLKADSPILYKEIADYDYYLYFDARDIYNGGINFTFDQKINPTDALNPKLIYKFRKYSTDYDNLVNISNNNITVIGIGGLGFIDICAVDSYSAMQDEYLTKVTVLLKVADGLTKSTSLEVSSINDLLKINSINGLDKFYIQTKNINLSSQSNWTPIGYINGELHEFNGNYDGLVASNTEENNYATISGIRLVSYANDTKSYYGLFAKLTEDAVVENLNIDILNVNINSESRTVYVGSVAGQSLGEIRNISSNFINGGYDILKNVNITAQTVLFGGIVGQNGDIDHPYSHIFNVYASGQINISATDADIGGLVGENYSIIDGATTFFNQSQFNYSYNSDMYIVATNLSKVGGIVGTTYAEVKNVSFAGTLVAKDNVGGIAGKTYADIYNSYSCGYIQAQNNVGGLVGYAKSNSNQKIKISNSSTNMFNDKNDLTTAIIAQNKVGGLVGYAENVSLQNTYSRSYINPDKDGFVADLKVDNNEAYVGGLIGYAVNTEIQKSYSILKISTAENSEVGGLVGYAENVAIQNAFERNTATLTGLAVGEVSGTNSLQYFYSSNDGAVGLDGQFVKINVLEQTQVSDWQGWNITTEASMLSMSDWYIKPNQSYPFIIFGDNVFKLLTVEPPSSINVEKKDSGSFTNYLYQINGLADNYVLYRSKNSVLKFNNLFNVSVLPQDELLNIGLEYSLSSSDSNIIQINGRTSMDYKLKLNSTGKVVLKLTSKFSTDISKEITIYVLNAVRDFEIKSLANQNLLVGTQYELVSSVSNSYVNNEDYYIKYDNNTNGKILINGSEQATVWHKNNEKVFITSTKSGLFTVKYSLYTKLVIDNVEYYIPLINDNLGGVEEIQDKSLNFNFIYGIKDFLCDTTVLETGLNDYANIKYTLTGDDLRIANNGYKLPNMSVKYKENNDFDYWNLKLVYVYLYFGENDYEVVTTNSLELQHVLINDKMQNIYKCQSLLTDSLNNRIQNENNRIIKVEYLFEIKVNSALVQSLFKVQNDKEKFQSYLTATASIVDGGEINETNTAQKSMNLIIKRQKLDNISLNFYTNAEKIKDNEGNDVYTINEVPSNAIIAGQTGMLKIALAPVNAEIKSVKVSYQSAEGYNLSMLQVLKHTTLDDDGITETVDYVVRKPYAIASENGTALELYHNESNWYKGSDINPDYTTYDGFLYVNCIISSNIPTNSIISMTVDVIYINNYHLSSTINLISRLPSTIKISYNFDQIIQDKKYEQVVQDKAYLPVNVEKEFYVDFVEIVEPEEFLNIEQMLSPHKVFGYDNISFVRNYDKTPKVTIIGSGYRVYYKIKGTEINNSQTIKATVTKVKNGIQTTFQSNNMTFVFVEYVITGVKINDGGNNTNIITVPQSTTKRLDVTLSYEVVEQNNEILGKVNSLTNQINTTMKCWFGRKINSIQEGEDLSKFYQLSKDNTYENYYVYDQTGEENKYIAVGVKHINTTAIIFNEVAIDYSTGYPEYIDSEQSEFIGNKIGLAKNGEKYVQYVRDDVTLNLVSDVSSKNPIPINDEREFLQMTSGEEGKMLYYALNDNLVLDEYLPMELQNICLDGNMHTITIKSFKTKTEDEDGNIAYYSNYGLFKEVGTNAIVQNLNIKYDGLVNISDNDSNNELITKDDGRNIDFGLDSFNFGGVCVQNNGIIYNVTVESKDDKLLKFTNNSSNQNYIAGICANNAGYISYTTSKLSIEANCGYVAGFVAVNSRKISNSKVLNKGSVTNTFTSEAKSLTAGFVARNSGDIFGCYIGDSYLNEDKIIYNSKIESRSTVGGFVNDNSGNVSNCYTDVEIVSTTRASGFVFNNSGNVESCYSSSSLLQNSNAHTPFVGTNELGTRNLNSGTIDDCYYIASSDEFTSITPKLAVATKVETDDGDNTQQESFAKFVFAEKNKLNGIWTYKYNNSTPTGNPKLVDADLEIHSEQYFNGLEMDEEDGTTQYSWKFENDTPEYGQITNGKYNPRTLTNIEEWNSILGNKNTNGIPTDKDLFVVLKDIVSSRDETPATSIVSFGGILLGNNMQLSNLYLRVTKDNVIGKSFGLFKEITKKDTDKDPIIKDLHIVARQVVASNARNVGTLAGFINNASITNIDIDCSAVEAIQGRNMVGALAGVINDSKITKINASGSVNAGYIDKNYEFANYYNNYDGKNYYKDLEILTEDDNSTADAPYSYAGTLTGALLGNTTATFINITGDNKVIGYYTGSIVGLVDKQAQLILAHTELVASQYTRAYALSGGVVGENRGKIDRTYIEHEESVQYAIDTDLSTKTSYGVDGTTRNLNFFRGSPHFIGGFVGFNNGGTISNSYSKLDVRTSTYITLACGGFVGLDVGGNIQNCYATGSVIGIYNIGGFIGAVSNEQTLLGYTFNDAKVESPERNNKDAQTTNNSSPIFLSNYEYSTFEGKRSQIHLSEKRQAYICEDKTSIDGGSSVDNLLYLRGNIASNKWLFGHENYDVNRSSDAEYLTEANVGLFIGAVVDKQAKQKEDLPTPTEANEDLLNDCYGYNDTELNSVFRNDFDNENEFISDFWHRNYVNTQAYKVDRNPTVNLKNIDRYNDGEIFTAILSYVNPNGEIPHSNRNIDEVTGKIKTGIINAIEYRSIGQFKRTFTFDQVSEINLPTNLCFCTANPLNDSNRTLITFTNIIKRDELLVEKEDGLYIGFEAYIEGMLHKSYKNPAKIFELPTYAGSATVNDSPIYPKIVCNINIDTHNYYQ